LLLLIGFLTHLPTAKAASAISLAGIDFEQLCRDTAHVPLVQAAIHPAYINVWSVQESREHRRYEQYTFRTQRIDVRVEHDISLYHGLIHRTLDLIGESQWKYRDLPAQEDYEHWLIYHTLELHWPGMQRRHGNEPTRTILSIASEYWLQYAERYAEIETKAAALARKSWCATNKAILEVNAAPPRPAPPEQRANPLLLQVAQAARELPGQVRTPRPLPAPPSAPLTPSQETQPEKAAAQTRAEQPPGPPGPVHQAQPQQFHSPAASLAAEPIGIASEFAAVRRPAEDTPQAQAQQAELPAQPASTERPTPTPDASRTGAPVPGAPKQPAPVSLGPRVEPVKIMSEFFVALPEPEEKPPTPAWPAPSVISADLPADPTLPASNWR
jgi:hypothetical protein